MKKPFFNVPCQEIACYPAGEQPVEFLPGDFILTHGEGWFARFIKLGQSFRFKGEEARFATWTHAALIINTEGELVEALSDGVKQTHISKYLPKEYCVVRIDASDIDRQQMVSFAQHCLEAQYGWATILSIGLSLLTGLKFSFGFDGQQICSGLVARSLERTTAIFDRNSSNIAPADLALYYNVAGQGSFSRVDAVKPWFIVQKQFKRLWNRS